MFYAVYPEVRGVAYAIKEWKRSDCEVNIHNYLNVYAELRHRINDIRKGRVMDD